MPVWARRQRSTLATDVAVLPLASASTHASKGTHLVARLGNDSDRRDHVGIHQRACGARVHEHVELPTVDERELADNAADQSVDLGAASLEDDLAAGKSLGVEDVEETGTSFVENALLKARHAARATRARVRRRTGMAPSRAVGQTDLAQPGPELLSPGRDQPVLGRTPPRLLAAALRAMETKRFVDWSFGHYLKIAHPSLALPARRGPTPGAVRQELKRAA
jgi:hypothetical protein